MYKRQELVHTVVLEVLERIDGRGNACVMVLATRDAALVERIAPLVVPFFGEGTEILFPGEDCAGRTPQKYILPELSLSLIHI